MRRSMLVGALALASGTALALPWDLDMADSQAVKAYEQHMASPAPGTAAQPSALSPKGFVPNFVRGSPEGEALTMPEFGVDPTAVGKQMFSIYCTPCHGDGATLGLVAAPGRFPGVVALSGPDGVAHMRSDGYLYLTIRNGSLLMPSYGWALSDAEMWSVVAYVRTLPNAAWTPPAPEAP